MKEPQKLKKNDLGPLVDHKLTTVETEMGELEHYEEIEMATDRCETEGDMLIKERKEPTKKTAVKSNRIPGTKL